MNKPVIFFDGVCNFCNGSVQFIIKRDPEQKFTFCPLQSEEAERQLALHGIKASALQTIILLKNGKVYSKSRAALEIVKKLRGLWPVLYAFVIVPPFIRDFFYAVMARNRYKWFGRSDSCMVPTDKEFNRFLV